MCESIFFLQWTEFGATTASGVPAACCVEWENDAIIAPAATLPPTDSAMIAQVTLKKRKSVRWSLVLNAHRLLSSRTESSSTATAKQSTDGAAATCRVGSV